VRASTWGTRSIQLVASCLKRSLAGLSRSLCMPSLMVFVPTPVFSLVNENDSPPGLMAVSYLIESKWLVMTA
jgi:hypothetical protein